MSQDTKDYCAGQRAYHEGVPFDRTKSEAWREGWNDADAMYVPEHDDYA